MRRKDFCVIPVQEPTDSDAAAKGDGEGMLSKPISGWTVRGNLFVRSVFGRDLFDHILGHFGRKGWNRYIERIQRHSLCDMLTNPEPVDETEFCMPVCLEIALSGQSFRGMDLRGMDFSIVGLNQCDFTETNLSGSILGSVEDSNFHASDLTRTLLWGDVSGAHFEGAKTKWLRIRWANYLSKKPPTGLPAGLMKRMRPFPAHWGTEMEKGTQSKDLVFPLKPISTTLGSVWGEMP